ncbi:Flagellar biosynthetic protein FliU [compost metagenome]
MKDRVLMPIYMKNFTCIGGICEDSCCIGWRVTFDKKAYKSYKNLKHPQLSKIFQSNMKRNKSETVTNNTYASFQMDESGDALCLITIDYAAYS